jgi:SAM-dependent methyltransferase
MTHDFDKAYWDEHWAAGGGVAEVNPHLVSETAAIAPGTALDAGCGVGTEATWLAEHGWRVVGVDIAAQPRDPAADVEWVTADLTTWEPETTFDLVTTFYAHPSIPQLDFYDRISRWVAPGGTLLIVGHLHDGHHPDEASVTSTDVAARFGEGWRVDTAVERTRDAAGHGRLADVVVRMTRV